jgi:hypothetical protein
MKNAPQLPDMALEAIENLLIADDLNDIRDTMTDLLLGWIINAEEPDLTERRKKVFHYQVIIGLITDAQAIKDGRPLN